MSSYYGPFPIGWYPDEGIGAIARFLLAYDTYAERITATGQTPASQEVILEEARRSPLSAEHTLYRKIAALKP